MSYIYIYIGCEVFTPFGETFTPFGETYKSLGEMIRSVQMDTKYFTTLTLIHLNVYVFNVKLLQKPYGKNMRSVLLYNPSKTQ
jgi:hypothetical protein